MRLECNLCVSEAHVRFSHWSGRTRLRAMHAGSFSGFPPALLTTASGDWVKKTVPLTSRSLAALDKTRQLANALQDVEQVCIVRSQSVTQRSFNLELLMPYVRGQSGYFGLLHASPRTLQAYRASLSAFFKITANYSIARPIMADTFTEKLAALNLAQSPKLEAIRREFVTRLKRHMELESLEGLCHGDLSLGNMVFHGNVIHLLDALPIFHESPLQDAAKVLLEAKYGLADFSLAREVRAQLRIAWRHSIPAEVTEYAHQYPETVSALIVTHILRIYPYARERSAELASWLEATAEEALQEFAAGTADL